MIDISAYMSVITKLTTSDVRQDGWRLGCAVLRCVQLRYYNGNGSAEDSLKDVNVIELKDVVAVAPMKSVPGAAKKADENAFFEVLVVCMLQ